MHTNADIAKELGSNPIAISNLRRRLEKEHGPLGTRQGTTYIYTDEERQYLIDHSGGLRSKHKNEPTGNVTIVLNLSREMIQAALNS